MIKQASPKYGNCLFSLFYLFLRGKISKIAVVNSNSRFFPIHFIILNRRNNAIHFHNILPHKENRLAPWWFLGRHEVILASKQDKYLKKHKRKIYFVTKKIKWFMSFSLTVIAVYSIPWIVSWALYSPIWAVVSGAHAVRLNIKQRKMRNE